VAHSNATNAMKREGSRCFAIISMSISEPVLS
jgi:hypothetical protein